MTRPAPLEHSSFLAGHGRDAAHILATQVAQGRPVARLLANARRHPA